MGSRGGRFPLRTAERPVEDGLRSRSGSEKSRRRGRTWGDPEPGQLPIPKMPFLIPPADEELRGGGVGSGDDGVSHGDGLEGRGGIGEILDPERDRAGLGGAGRWRSGRVDLRRQVDRLARGKDEAGGHDFVDGIGLIIFSGDLHDDGTRGMLGATIGHAQAPTCGERTAVPPGDQGIHAGIRLQVIELRDGLNGEMISETRHRGFQSLESAAWLQPEGLTADGGWGHLGELLAGGAQPGLIGEGFPFRGSR